MYYCLAFDSADGAGLETGTHKNTMRSCLPKCRNSRGQSPDRPGAHNDARGASEPTTKPSGLLFLRVSFALFAPSRLERRSSSNHQGAKNAKVPQKMLLEKRELTD